ncbi:putative glycosyltransferase [Pseudohyphozyma bogoriensis]|nr:putative glycosyltransferase [Pseudohyphozyma bogoriensis]
MVAQLDNKTQSTYNWLRTSRSTSETGTPIGLSSRDPPDAIRRGHARADAGAGPGEFVTGSPEKYGRLVTEWKTGRQTTACEAGASWEREYAELHQGMLNGAIEPRIVQYSLMGIMSSFTYSILTKRAFLISWEWPAPMDLIFDSPFLDWSTPYHPEDTNHTHPLFEKEGFAGGPHVVDAVNWGAGSVDDLMANELKTDWEGHPWVSFVANRGALYRSFAHAPHAASALHSLGLQPSTAYTCLFNYLLRPKADVANLLAQYSALFSLPEIFSIAIQIRTGDGSMWNSDADKDNTVARYQHYFTCASQLAASLALPSQKIIYYLVSDSEHLKLDALRTFPDQVVLTGIGASHVLEDQGPQQVWNTVDRLQDAVADSWAQGDVDAQIITNDSGFGKIHAFRRGREGTTISLPRQGGAPDCGMPDSLTSFRQLSEAWSLGKRRL